MRSPRRLHALLAAAFLLACGPALALSGSVRSQAGEPIPYAFVGLLDASWQLVAHDSTDARGTFDLALDDPPADGSRLVVQPPGNEGADGLAGYRHAPRMVDVAGLDEAVIVLPAVGALVLHAYDAEGELLRWADFEARGMFGANFVYWTDGAGRMLESSIWPVHDNHSREQGNPRELGLPGIMAAPGSSGVVQALYWETAGYGKLWLEADNGGAGFTVPPAGGTSVIPLNVELARTAVEGLARRADAVQAGLDETAAPLQERMAAVLAEADPVAAAAQADAILAEALRARDDLELAHAKAQATHRRPGFSFGVFQGGAYQRRPMERAREAGFDLATVLTGWGWSDLSAQAIAPPVLDNVLGISALHAQGYAVKTHGSVWLQEYGILPERTRGMSNRELHDGFLDQQAALLGAFGDRIELWEAMNEPAATNERGFSRAEINRLLAASAAQLKEAGKTTLVNSGIESNFGNKYQLYTPAGDPVEAVTVSYLESLEAADEAGALDAIDIIGIQFYPGARNADRLGGINGPMMTLGWLVDTLDRFAAFGKPLHITEFSVPSRYDDGWTSGTWREPWTEDLQAEYAEAVFLIAYAHPAVESITWWDVTDDESSVISGGLMTLMGEPKPVFERVRALIAGLNALTEASE